MASGAVVWILVFAAWFSYKRYQKSTYRKRKLHYLVDQYCAGMSDYKTRNWAGDSEPAIHKNDFLLHTSTTWVALVNGHWTAAFGLAQLAWHTFVMLVLSVILGGYMLEKWPYRVAYFLCPGVPECLAYRYLKTGCILPREKHIDPRQNPFGHNDHYCQFA